MTILSNNPPPEAVFSMAIDDLVAEAANFLDGSEIESEGQATALGQLVDQLRNIAKGADKARKDEKAPIDEAGKAVQAKWKPIIDKANLTVETMKRPLTRYLEREEAKQRAEAESKRKEAEEATAKVRELAQQSNPDDLKACLDIAAAEKQAEQLAKAADRADKQKAHVTGGARAMALRTSWEAELVDPVAALKWAKERHPEELKAWLLQEAQRDVNAGVRSIAGFVIHERKKAA